MLILDEPTNHLDIQAVEWLESWLGDWSGAAIVVSHDRYFMDRTVDTIWELSFDGLEIYRGNYSAYLQQRLERRNEQLSQFKSQQAFIRKEEDFIRRNIAGQNTGQAQGRRKRLNRLRRDHLVDKPKSKHLVHIQFEKSSRSGDRVIETNGLEIGFIDEPSPLFRAPDLLLLRGERVGIMGPNGAGKTTFLRTIIGEIPPFSGAVKLGANLKLAYFTQAHEGLNPEFTVLEELRTVAPNLKDGDIRNILALFLFRGDEVFKPIDALSGGERGRVALAKLMLEGANLLLLDEPTNHLDIPSQEALQSALSQFPGTLLLISHDRYLINALASQVWIISPEESSMEIFTGRYAEYQVVRKQRDLKRKATRKRVPAKRAKSKEKKVKVNLEEIEARITDLEGQLSSISEALIQAGGNIERVRELGAEYATLEKVIAEEMTLWEQAANHQEQA
jgi:ATP-binding cassette subfamily F protein 3